MSMFNAQGEVNAGDLAEAFNVIQKYAQILQAGQPANTALAGQPSFTDQEQDELVARAILTSDGKVALAQTMANPIRYWN